jgi:hypothetical protein
MPVFEAKYANQTDKPKTDTAKRASRSTTTDLGKLSHFMPPASAMLKPEGKSRGFSCLDSSL